MQNPFKCCLVLPVLAVFFLLIPLTGCGDKKRPGEDGASHASPGAGASQAAGENQGTPSPGQAINAKKVIIRVLDKETGKPRPGAAVRIFGVSAGLASTASFRDGKTNLDGEVVFEVTRATRLMVKSEYSFEKEEFKLEPDGDTVVTLNVRTTFEVSGRVTGPTGEGLEGAELFLVRFTPGKGFMEKGAPVPGAGMDIEAFRRRFGYDMDVEAKTGKEGLFSCKVNTCQPLLAAAYYEGLTCAEWRMVSFSSLELRYTPVEIRLLQGAGLSIMNYDAMNRPLGNHILRFYETSASRCTREDPGTILAPYMITLISEPDGSMTGTVPAGLDLIVENRLIFPEPREGEDLPDPVRSPPLNSIKPAPGETRKFVALPYRAVRLHGAVQDEGENWITGATLSIPGYNQIQTRQEGLFSLLVPYNIHQRPRYMVSKEGFRTVSALLPELPENTMELRLDVVLVRYEDVKLVSSNGIDQVWLIKTTDPAARGVVSVTGCELLPDAADIARCRESLQDDFLFKGIAPGKVSLLVQRSHSHFVMIENVMITPTEDHQQVIDLRALMEPEAFENPGEASIEGVVEIPESIIPHKITIELKRNDVPLAGQVNIQADAGRMGLGKILTSAHPVNGAFSIIGQSKDQGLPTGRYVLSAAITEWDTRMDAYLEVELKPGLNKVVLAAAPPGELGSINVTVIDTSSRPVPGISMILLDPMESPLGRPGRVDPFSYTDREGSIRLDNLQPGRYVIALGRPDRGETLINARVEVKPGASSEVNIVLSAEGS